MIDDIKLKSMISVSSCRTTLGVGWNGAYERGDEFFGLGMICASVVEKVVVIIPAEVRYLRQAPYFRHVYRLDPSLRNIR